jgi:outer membrane protein OmpA-like peptidoglycan-associated protein
MGINGSYIHTDPDIYPRLQSFPVFPSESVQPGESWTAYGTRMVDPFRDGTYTRVRFLCRYHYQGKQTIYGGEHAVVHAQYALRYRRGDDPDGDTRIHEISGTHQATLYIDLSNGIPTFMRERVNEHYSLEGDETIGFKGFVLTWWKPVITLEKARLVENLEKELSERGVSDVGVSEHDQGVALNINKIHFIADKAQVLPEEEDRLTELARTLARIEERTIKVVGHTARVGTEESQYRLSVERAKTIVDYLSENGINSKRLIYEGKGGSEPIAPNDTEENMAKNRRVEIIIMED